VNTPARVALCTAFLIGGFFTPRLTAAPKTTPAATAGASATREIKLSGKLLLYPVSKGKNKGKLSVRVDGALIHNLEGNLSQTRDVVAWWAYLDLGEYVGKTAVLTISAPDNSTNLFLIESSNEERHLLPLYDERMRPQFHHSQKQGWNNDPNGMVYYDGEYHLFWQCNPVGQGHANPGRVHPLQE
jgi:hypothetical protein